MQRHSYQNEWIPRKTGLHGVNTKFKFALKPSKEKGNIYYFNYGWKDTQTGKWKHSKISTRCRTVKAAEACREELEETILSRLFEPLRNQSDKQTLQSLISEFLRTKKQDRLRAYSLRAYTNYLKRFTDTTNHGIDPNTPLCNVSPELIRDFLSSIDSDSSNAHARRVLTVLFRYAVENDRMDKNPIYHVKKRKTVEPCRDWLDETEFQLLWERMPETTFKQRTIKNAALLAHETGMRSGEIRHAQIQDAREANTSPSLSITHRDGFKTKGGRERIVSLSDRAILALARQRKNRLRHPESSVRESKYLFPNSVGKPFDVSEFSRMFASSRRAVMPDREGCHFHTMRHSNAQNAMNNGASLIEIGHNLGHRGTAITEKYYAKPSDFAGSEKLRTYRNSLPPLREMADSDGLGDTIQDKELISCYQSELTT